MMLKPFTVHPCRHPRAKAILVLSPRLWAWLRMEATELMGPNVKAVVPNAITIAEQLLDLYPVISAK